MKTTTGMFLGLALVGLSSAGFASDRTGTLGLNYTVGPSFVIGGSRARDLAPVQPGVGAALQLGLTRNADFTFSYDYLDADLHSQAITFGGQWRFLPEKALCPFVGAGLGFGKPFTTVGWGHFSLKLGGGIEKTLTSSVSLAGVFNYQFVDGPDPLGSLHAIEPGARVIFYFGKLPR